MYIHTCNFKFASTKSGIYFSILIDIPEYYVTILKKNEFMIPFNP